MVTRESLVTGLWTTAQGQRTQRRQKRTEANVARAGVSAKGLITRYPMALQPRLTA